MTPCAPASPAAASCSRERLRRSGPRPSAKSSRRLKRYDEFDAANDPYGEHDFGAVEIKGTRFFFKIDYYDRDYAFASADPADENVTCRVMTIMLAEDY